MNDAAYPIFFPTYTPIPTGYARDWWWYDPDVNPEDVGPFETRSEAVADWALHHFSVQLIQEAKSLDSALEHPLLKQPVLNAIPQAMPVLRKIIAEQQSLTDKGFETVEFLNNNQGGENPVSWSVMA